MLDRIVGVVSLVPFVIGSLSGTPSPKASVELSFADPAIVESSGLVAAGDGLFLTTNDSGDGGRVFVVDDSGETVGTTSWSPGPEDVEALAPAGPGEVWVGDTGDNRRSREHITVLRVPYDREDRTVTPTAYELVYPDHAHDAETLLAQPRTGRLLVVTKDVFGGRLYAAPRELSTEHPNRLREVTHSFSFATDGSFFPDGRHYVVRGYTGATVYTYPGHEPVGSFPLPAQRQGEGISVGAGDELYLSTEGQYSDVLRMALPRPIARAMAVQQADRPSAAPTASAAREPEVESGPMWPWLVAGLLVVGSVVACVVGAGWLLFRRGQAS